MHRMRAAAEAAALPAVCEIDVRINSGMRLSQLIPSNVFLAICQC